MADLYLTPAERYTAALGGFYYGDLPEPGTVYTQLIKDILDGSTPDKVPKNILARFIYSLYISDLGDPYPRYELAKLLYWKLHDITPTKSGSILTVTIDGKDDYMTINTDLSRLWYKVLFGSKTDVITEFPYVFNTMQNKLSDWELFGNTSISGTPTPDSLIMPQGTGERTSNLFNIATITTGYRIQWTTGNSYADETAVMSDYIPVTTGTYSTNVGYLIIGYDNSKAYVGVHRTEGTWGKRSSTQVSTFTVSAGSDVSYIKLLTYGDYASINEYTRVNEGSTSLPLEPYGYKIPISSASTTTPVYLGEVESTRKIKKLVLTGEETWYSSSRYTGSMYAYHSQFPGIAKKSPIYCSHLIAVDSISQYQLGMCFCDVSSVNLWFFDTTTSPTNFKSYLAQQYAAGTPVTVWYVLAEPETGIVNEPLMKIGDYADSMSRTQTGIDIPTVVGQNTLDVLTTVKPSSMSIEYTSADENRSRSKRISLLKSPLKKVSTDRKIDYPYHIENAGVDPDVIK